MKIEKRGIRITELPKDLVISTLTNGGVEFVGDTFTMAEIREIRDALNVVLGEGSPEQWSRLSDIPEDVRSVVDKDGDPLTRTRWENWPETERENYERNYSPFTRA